MSCSSSTSSSPPTTLKVLTLNVWGLAHISKSRRFRIRHIADRLAEGDWDLVALQEIWVESEDWRFLSARCSRRLPHTKFFYSGAFGSGLAILSRFPIFATHTHPYALNGLPLNVGQGDWFVGKAAGSVSIDLGDGLVVDVFNTHTVAAGGEDGEEKLRAHRLMQAWELSKLVQNSAEKGRHVIAVGDFNSTPPSLSINLLRNLGHLSDAFLSTHPSLPPNAVTLSSHQSPSGASPDPEAAIAKLGVTADSPLNTWTRGKKLDKRAEAGAGKRLDYIFYRGPYAASSEGLDPAARQMDQNRLKPVECEVCFTESVPGSAMSYTDHFGVEATFEILVKSSSAPATTDTALNTLADRNVRSTLTSCISALGAYMHHSSSTQRSHLLGFCLCLTLAFALAVVAPLIGHQGYRIWAALAIVLATTAGWGGTTLLYSGVIWGEWEKRALRTAIDSMELDLSFLSRSRGHGIEHSHGSEGGADPSPLLNGRRSPQERRTTSSRMQQQQQESLI